MEKIKLQKVTGAGCYTMNYIFDGHILTCGDCAEKIVNDEEYDIFVEDIKNYDEHIYWEGESTYCDNCDEEIESEYGIPE